MVGKGGQCWYQSNISHGWHRRIEEEEPGSMRDIAIDTIADTSMAVTPSTTSCQSEVEGTPRQTRLVGRESRKSIVHKSGVRMQLKSIGQAETSVGNKCQPCFLLVVSTA